MESPLADDPQLRGIPTLEGYKILMPCVLMSRIGQGGMGSVYLGHHLNLDVDVAVKCLKRSLAEENRQLVSRFQREARLAARINHRNLIHVYDVAHTQGLHYLVMEFVRGESLRERVKRKGRLDETEALTILLGAARGLGAAHKKGIVHRDVKPDNILVSSEGAVKVADLGLAKAAGYGDTVLSMPDMIMGTPKYMAPEQWSTTDVGTAADVWALGATAYYLLAGRDAITGDTPEQLAARSLTGRFPDITAQRDDLSPGTAEMIARCTAREPGERYRDGQELAEVIRGILGSEPDDLGDEMAGVEMTDAPLVSPPPVEALGRIRSALADLDPAALGADFAWDPGLEGAVTLPPDPGDDTAVETSPRPAAGNPPPVVAGRVSSPRRRLGFVVAAVVLIGGATVFGVGFGAAGQGDASRLYVEAQELARAGDWAGAEKRFQQVFNLDRDFAGDTRDRLAAARVGLAREASAASNFAAAVRWIEEARRVPGLSVPSHRAIEEADRALAEAVARVLSADFRLTSPKPGTPTNRAEVQVTGTVSRLLQSLVLNDRPVDGSRLPEFRVDGHRLTEGVNDLHFAGALRGSTRRFPFATRKVKLDTRAPAVAVTTPEPGGSVPAKVTVTGSVDEPCAVQVVAAGRSVAAAVREDLTWSANLELSSGPVEVRILARDGAGNRSEPLALSLMVDGELPGLVVTAPVPNATVASPVVVAGSVDEPCRINVSGPGGQVSVPVGTAGAWSAKLPCGHGPATITVVATDPVGNATRQQWNVEVDARSPTFTFTGPTLGARVSAPVSLGGTVDEPGQVEIKVSGGATELVEVPGTRWSASLRLALGDAVVTLTAIDRVGNRSQPTTLRFAVVPGIPPALAGDVARLSSGDPIVRFKAVEILLGAGEPAVLPNLVAMLKDADPDVRWVAAEGLEKFKAAPVVDGLLDALMDSVAKVRSAAVRSLRRLTGQSFPFEVDGDEAARARDQARFREWWKRNRGRF